MGKWPNKAQSLTKDEEEIIWQNGQLSDKTPRSVLITIWWLLTMHFGLCSQQEHNDMKVEDFSFEKDGGIEFVTFSEGLTKTRGGRLRVKPPLATPKMFATGEKRCPVTLF